MEKDIRVKPKNEQAMPSAAAERELAMFGAAAKREYAIFGAGCFWGVQDAFKSVPGVVETEVGYSGGHKSNPTYKDVCTGLTGHAEVVRVEFDPSKISFQDLVAIFWTLHDPTTMNRQGPDVGSQYRSAIFYYTEEQKAIAEGSKEALDGSGTLGRPIVTEIAPAREFWRAEEYHQDYYEKPGRRGCRI